MRWIPSALSVVLPVGCLAVTVGAQQTHQSNVWTEHVLKSVPRGLSPTVMAWDSWLSFTPDLSTLVYAVRFRSGGGWRESIMIGDNRQLEYNYASRPVVSPDGRHVAYIAVVESGDNLPAFLVVDTSRLQIQDKDHLLGPDWIPVFAPDSTKLAFRGERPGGRYAIGVAAVPAEKGEALRVQWGPEFDAIDRPTWSPDSLTAVYAAARSTTEWVVMKSQEVVGSFADVSYVEFAPDGRLAFRASDGKRQFIVLGPERQPPFDLTTGPTFQRDGTLVYTASDRGKHFAIVGAARTELAHAAEGAVASADGKRITPWYREVRGSKRRLVVNGIPGPEFVRVSKPSIHAETGSLRLYGPERGGLLRCDVARAIVPLRRCALGSADQRRWDGDGVCSAQRQRAVVEGRSAQIEEREHGYAIGCFSSCPAYSLGPCSCARLESLRH